MNKKQVAYWFMVVLIGIGISIPIYYKVSTMHMEWTNEVSNPTMIVEGQFDRVEILDRHYGNINGMEVVDEQLAVIYENGTVPIAKTHYEGSYMNTNKNFGFLLRIYWEHHHLSEEIDVMGGAVEEFKYLNVTIIVSLAIETKIHHAYGTPKMGIGSVIMVLCVVLTISFFIRNKVIGSSSDIIQRVD